MIREILLLPLKWMAGLVMGVGVILLLASFLATIPLWLPIVVWHESRSW